MKRGGMLKLRGQPDGLVVLKMAQFLISTCTRQCTCIPMLTPTSAHAHPLHVTTCTAGRAYCLTYRPDTRKCYVLLKKGASQGAVLQAALDAHCLLWMLDEQKAAAAATCKLPPNGGASNGSSSISDGGGVVAQLHRAARLSDPAAGAGSAVAAADALAFVAGTGGRQVEAQFERQAKEAGWQLHMTMLNPKETRLVVG